MIAPDDRVTLAPGLMLIPTTQLSAADQRRISPGVVLTKTHDRSRSVLLDQQLADLLKEFSEPTTLTDAVLRYCQQRGEDAQDTLTQAYGALQACAAAGYLLLDEGVARETAPTLRAGDEVAGGSVVRSLSLLSDTEVHELQLSDGTRAVLKLAKPDATSAEQALRREAAILDHLGGRVAPRLIGQGTANGCAWLTLEWFDGSSLASTRASRLGRSLRASIAGSTTPADRAQALALATAVARAYARLHALGVVHGDVHPGNILVSSTGRIAIIDFGVARYVGGDDNALSEVIGAVPRAGISAYLDPQYAAACRDRRVPEQASLASDQYCLAAVLYEILTGERHLDLPIEADAAWETISRAQPLPFHYHGLPAWPGVEGLLRRALATSPEDRFPNIDVLARRLAAQPAPSPTELTVPISDELATVLATVLRRAGPGGDWFENGLTPRAPTATLAYGAAGLALTLLHVSVARDDPHLLTLADEWIVRAQHNALDSNGLVSTELGITDASVGRTSPFHSLPGIHAVAALIAHARADRPAQRIALNQFLDASRPPCAGLDVTLGRGGTLLACALLLDGLPGLPAADRGRLVRLGNDTHTDLWTTLDDLPPIADATTMTFLGIAHGWAGLLHATLRWARATSTPVPPHLTERLDQLAEMSRQHGTSITWPMSNRHAGHRGAGSAAGWCHGSAGQLHLWSTAHAVLGDDAWGDLAERTARHAADADNTVGQLCCGLTGQAYALLEHHHNTGNPNWLRAAEATAARAPRRERTPWLAASLHKGDAGIAALAVDLEHGALGAMPFFGSCR